MQDLSISSQGVVLQRSALNFSGRFLPFRDSAYLDEIFRLESDDNYMLFFYRCRLFDTRKRMSVGRVLSEEVLP